MSQHVLGEVRNQPGPLDASGGAHQGLADGGHYNHGGGVNDNDPKNCFHYNVLN